jgi:hypothetical protein
VLTREAIEHAMQVIPHVKPPRNAPLMQGGTGEAGTERSADWDTFLDRTCQPGVPSLEQKALLGSRISLQDVGPG